MVQAGIGLDTPHTNLGDATYLMHQPDFDISQEQSFQSPLKGHENLLQQLQNGKRGLINLKTPRSRAPLVDRRNAPSSFNVGEFTPLLKSATRNSALKIGKENGKPQTPAFLKPGGLNRIPEDTPLPHMSSSVYGDDNRLYADTTPVPQIESSSVASTPMTLLPRRGDDQNVLQDGNQLSLREQENVIDKIEKENFGLKLKIHFLEEALRKAGPGFSEAALKENTELKVDKVTMQKELHRYRRTLTTAERELEEYRQQIVEMQERVKRKHADEDQREELGRLQQALQRKEVEAQEFKGRLIGAERQDGEIKRLQDEIGDLEADLREKERLVDEREDEVDNLKETIKAAQRREQELEGKAHSADDLAEAKEAMEAMEEDIDLLKDELKRSKEEYNTVVSEKKRAEADLEELQNEMANKSITTKGHSRQMEERANRLKDTLEDLRESHDKLEKQHVSKLQEVETLVKKLEKSHSIEQELRHRTDERDLLQTRHDTLSSESTSLQRELSKSRSTIEDLEDKLEHEKTHSLSSEREVRDQYKTEIDRLNDEVEDLRADVREKERLYDDDSDKWDSERRDLESQRDRAEEQLAGLKRMVESLQQAEGSLSSKEAKLQQALKTEKDRHEHEEALIGRQADELKGEIESRRQALEGVRIELSTVTEELRLSQRAQRSLSEKVEALEDEVEVLQTSLDDETDRANADLAAAKEESKQLRLEVQSVKRDIGRELDEQAKERASSRLVEVEEQFAKAKRDKQELQDQFGQLKADMHLLRTNAASIEAERDELKIHLQHVGEQEKTLQFDQEKIDLRTSKTKLQSEVRRLKDEIKLLLEKHHALEKELEEEMERANNEEVRLKDELSNMRQQQTQFLQREATQKDTVRGLKRQIDDLERKAHAHELSQLQSTSPRSSSSGSARKSEIIEVRHQLATAHQTLKDLRTQLKEVERDATRKVSAAAMDLQAKTEAWESERFTMEREREQAVLAKEELQAKATAAESSVTRLRSRMDRLERELQNERRNATEDRTMALERRDLHDMLRETQIQAEELELVVKERDNTIAKITTMESDLRSQLKRVRDERATQRDRVAKTSKQLSDMEMKFRRARETWEEEKRTLSKGVRFPNMSVSDVRENETLLRGVEEKDRRHVKELRGLAMQIEWLRAKCRREESLRADAAYAKRFMMLQVELFGACNAADLQMLQQMGITPDRTFHEKKPRLRTVAFMIVASVRMRRGAERWAKSRRIHERLVTSLDTMRRTNKASGKTGKGLLG